MSKFVPKFKKNRWDDEVSYNKSSKNDKKQKRGDWAEQKRAQREFEAENMVIDTKKYD